MPKPLKPIEHGTQNAYNTHVYRKEEPCDECRKAHNDYCRAQQRANTRLRQAHREEYRAYFREELNDDLI